MQTRFDLEHFAGASPRFDVCLLYGNDPDLIEDRSADLVRHLAGSLNDPFRVSTLSSDDHGRLAAEISARSLTGGRRVVRVRDCGERLLPALAALDLAGSGTSLILLAGALTKRSKLRSWAEQAAKVAAIACNPDDRSQRRTFLDAVLVEKGLTVAREDRDHLLDRLPPGRRAMASELEKLALFSTSGTLEWAHASALLDSDGDASAFTAIDAALAGDGKTALTAWERAVEAGGSGVGIVRIAGSELGRLASAIAEVERGTPLREALERQRIYNRDPRFTAWTKALRRWTLDDAVRALGHIHKAEIACKSTGADERLVVASLLTALAGPGRAIRSE